MKKKAGPLGDAFLNETEIQSDVTDVRAFFQANDSIIFAFKSLALF